MTLDFSALSRFLWQAVLLLARSGLLTTVVVLACVGLIAESLWPAHPRRAARRGLNLFVLLASIIGRLAFTPAIGVVVTLAVNAAGGGLIVLPSRGLGLILGAGAYLFVMDLAEYLFHRAQHRVPAMWAMHSLHHSDTSFDSTTAVRHFWAEPLLKSVTVWLAVGLVFKASAPIVAVYGAISYYHFIVHSNTRLDFGRASWVLNSPGYHRLHHSSSPEHFDRNFASLLPIFDLVSGAYRRARPGERPATGLDDGDEPSGMMEALGWPMRRLLRRSVASNHAQEPRRHQSRPLGASTG